MKKLLFFVLGLVFLCGSVNASEATNYPVTIKNGNREVVFQAAPKRVVTNGDTNIIELIFALGLENKMVGYAGHHKKTVSPQHQSKLKKIPMISEGYIKLESLLGANPDFFLSGYYYGMDIPGDCTENCITPEELERFNIQSYAITESLIRIMDKPPVSLEDIYNDIRNLGIIFNVKAKAEKVIQSMKNRTDTVMKKVATKKDKKLNVFIFPLWGAPDNPPPTAASQAMPSALITLAGAKNIFSDLNDSWVKVTWEEVIGRNPDVILMLEYGTIPGEVHKQYILDDPALKGMNAVRNNKIFMIPVQNVYTGPRAIDGLEKIAEFLYPELF